MKAFLASVGHAAVVDRPYPEARDDMAVVRVELAGICNTDLEIRRGYMAFSGVLGHEFVGIVEAGPPSWVGRRVVGEINFGCGICGSCRGQLERHCPNRRVMGIVDADGAFAEAVAVPLRNLHEVPASVSSDEAVFVEPLAAAFEIVEQIRPVLGSTCTVLGDGKLGLLVAQVLDLAGARVLAVGHHDSHLGLLRRRGIQTVLANAWDHRATDIVVEATGTAAGLQAAIAATRPRGTVVLKSTVAQSSALNLAPVVIHEITIVGSRCGPFAPALRALEEKRVDVASLVSARFPLAKALDALDHAAAPGILKVFIEP